mgnify:CR=1 FL=1
MAIAAACMVVLAAMGLRATQEQIAAFEAAQVQQDAKQLDRAIVSYRRAVRWYTPWGPKHGKAVDALRQIADKHQKLRPEVAVQALDGLRSGLLASRSFYQPRAADLAYANTTLPTLLARVADRVGDKRPNLLKRFTADYARPVGVSIWVTFGVTLGFLLWIGSLVMAWAVGVDDEGRLATRGWRWMASSVAGFATWVLTLWLVP